MDKILFTSPETQEEISFFCLEQTTIHNQNYLLVTEDEEGDSDAYILKEISSEGEEAVYEMVEEDAELEAIGRIFSELIEDVDFEF